MKHHEPTSLTVRRAALCLTAVAAACATAMQARTIDAAQATSVAQQFVDAQGGAATLQLASERTVRRVRRHSRFMCSTPRPTAWSGAL